MLLSGREGRMVAQSADAAQQPRMFPRLELSAHYSSLNPLRFT
jgi:hypothetical protein